MAGWSGGVNWHPYHPGDRLIGVWLAKRGEYWGLHKQHGGVGFHLSVALWWGHWHAHLGHYKPYYGKTNVRPD